MGKVCTRNNDDYEIFLAYINETGLIVDMQIACLNHRVTLREIFLDVRGATVHAARLEIWWTMMNFGKTTKEVSRLFVRDVSSVSHAMKRLREHSSKLNLPLDIHHVRAIASDLAASNLKSWIKMGQYVASVNNERKK